MLDAPDEMLVEVMRVGVQAIQVTNSNCDSLLHELCLVLVHVVIGYRDVSVSWKQTSSTNKRLEFRQWHF
jgi:hypothetical protein